MNKSKSTMAQQIAQAAIAFEQRRTGNHVPKSVTVVLCEGTLVITLHDALSPAEKALAQNPAGAAQMQEFHRQLFASASDALRQEIKRITGMEVREATAEIEPSSGAVVQAFTTGTVGPGVPARRQYSHGILEREWFRQSVIRAEVEVIVTRTGLESYFAGAYPAGDEQGQFLL